MTPENELEIGACYEVLQRYVCKNRVTKAKIKMVRIKYLVNGHKQPGADVERFRELYRKQKQGAK